MYTILLVDDDQATLEANEQFFAENGYEVFCSATGRRAVEMIQTIKLDCVILDIDLPDEDGFDVCSRVRTFTSLPIIFLSNYTEEESRIRGLVIGGDDYVCKPFSQRELELRVRARIHQRYGDRPAEILQFDGLIINTGDRTVSFNRRYGEFSRIEFDILAFLARHPNRIYSYEQLYDNIWNEPLNESRHNVQARIASVRQKLFDLCPGKEYIQTVRRKGYQFVP
ncbi:DNA-binding response regulator [Clostridium sp. AF18-27]|uniref:Stage 0 sporulation protein A homolog n=1 Tax=Enterocloster lavalensis TaxID=460384 RepID=A0A1I0K121_9FIRM|nr:MULTISPECIES: response regulator transcription factor [Enterocloster]RHR52653.1 DNA-binding response regulator [Clostridium sp. AF18-27]MCB6346763.1 response regulator transcription factor [Enterocloster lavalensis]MDR3758867.1 response regulator transcription factor [Enterocloster sp.]PST33251.1 DNA-binding response regulator [Enterocloster lavalensis]SEU17081.1 DNA-binding response regulator, OmpR family, contains REC and winged-helix (wHTH) domain [Enterocloster lavalensis]